MTSCIGFSNLKNGCVDYIVRFPKFWVRECYRCLTYPNILNDKFYSRLMYRGAYFHLFLVTRGTQRANMKQGSLISRRLNIICHQRTSRLFSAKLHYGKFFLIDFKTKKSISYWLTSFLLIFRVERVLVENCLFNPFNDHVSRLRCVDEALDPLDSFRRVPVGNIKCSDRVPRRLMHHGDLCEGKFVSSVHCHPTFPGNFSQLSCALPAFTNFTFIRNRGCGLHN